MSSDKRIVWYYKIYKHAISFKEDTYYWMWEILILKYEFNGVIWDYQIPLKQDSAPGVQYNKYTIHLNNIHFYSNMKTRQWRKFFSSL